MLIMTPTLDASCKAWDCTSAQNNDVKSLCKEVKQLIKDSYDGDTRLKETFYKFFKNNYEHVFECKLVNSPNNSIPGLNVSNDTALGGARKVAARPRRQCACGGPAKRRSTRKSSK